MVIAAKNKPPGRTKKPRTEPRPTTLAVTTGPGAEPNLLVGASANNSIPATSADDHALQAQTARDYVRKVMQPQVRGAMTAEAYRPRGWRPAGYSKEEFLGAVGVLQAAVENSYAGNLSRADEMLVSQAHALDAIFHRLAEQAAAHIGLHADMVDRYLRLALKAQSQSRSTWESLANIKNPPVVFAKQANFAAGHQQVNNGVGASGAHGGKTETGPNELLEVADGQWVDPGAQGATVRGDQAMETVVPIDRSKVRAGKGAR